MPESSWLEPVRQVRGHELGLGTCPVTSFSAAALGVALDLPAEVVPELILTLGRPAAGEATGRGRVRERISVDDLIEWERIAEATGEDGR